jgi:MFS family permease
MSLMNYLALRKARNDFSFSNITTSTTGPPPKKRHFDPLASVKLFGDLSTLFILLYSAFLFASFYDIIASIPSLYGEIYGFNALQLGLCYLPFGVGCCAAALSNGQLLDRNFSRWALKLDFPIKKGRQQDLRNFPIEKVRLQIAIPSLYVACVLTLIYGWLLEINSPLAPVLILLFLVSMAMTVTFNVASTLLVDFYPKLPATATAANNLARCLFGAAATGLITPMLNTMGRGWTFTLLSLFLLVTSPMLWFVYFKGMALRENRRIRQEAVEKVREARKAGREEAAVEKKKDTPVVGGGREMHAVEEQEEEKAPGRVDRHELARTFSHESAV